MSNNVVNTLSYIRDGIICVGFLVGMGAGVFLLTRKRTLAGILAIAAFILFGLEPITDIIIFRIMFSQDLNISVFNSLTAAYDCISAFVFFVGSILLIVALIKSWQPKDVPSSDPVNKEAGTS